MYGEGLAAKPAKPRGILKTRRQHAPNTEDTAEGAQSSTTSQACKPAPRQTPVVPQPGGIPKGSPRPGDRIKTMIDEALKEAVAKRLQHGNARSHDEQAPQTANQAEESAGPSSAEVTQPQLRRSARSHATGKPTGASLKPTSKVALKCGRCNKQYTCQKHCSKCKPRKSCKAHCDACSSSMVKCRRH